jgi:rubrerythrin
MGSLLNASEIVEFAIYIEQNGYKFYVETLKKFREEKLAELFQFLADEELKHEQTFKGLLKKTGTFTPPESYPGEYEVYMRDFLKTHALANDKVLKEKLDSISTPKDAIGVALDFEKDSIVLFTALKKYIDPVNHKPVEAIIQEEMTHIIRITTFQQEQRL